MGEVDVIDRHKSYEHKQHAVYRIKVSKDGVKQNHTGKRSVICNQNNAVL